MSLVICFLIAVFYPLFSSSSAINDLSDYEKFFHLTYEFKKMSKKDISVGPTYCRALFSNPLLTNFSLLSEQKPDYSIQSFFLKKNDSIFFLEIPLFHLRDPIEFFDDYGIILFEKDIYRFDHSSTLPISDFSDIFRKKDSFPKVDTLDALVLDHLFFKYPPLPSCEFDSSPSAANTDSSKISAAAWLLGLGILGLVLIRRRVMR